MIRLPCKSCGSIDIPKKRFYSKGRLRSVSTRCVMCYKEDERERARRYKRSNPLYYKNWLARHPEKSSEYQKRYRHKNHDKYIAWRRVYESDPVRRRKNALYQRMLRRKTMSRNPQFNFEKRQRSRWVAKIFHKVH